MSELKNKKIIKLEKRNTELEKNIELKKMIEKNIELKKLIEKNDKFIRYIELKKLTEENLEYKKLIEENIELKKITTKYNKLEEYMELKNKKLKEKNTKKIKNCIKTIETILFNEMHEKVLEFFKGDKTIFFEIMLEYKNSDCNEKLIILDKLKKYYKNYLCGKYDAYKAVEKAKLIILNYDLHLYNNYKFETKETEIIKIGRDLLINLNDLHKKLTKNIINL
jgi:hypothetical protein